MGRERIKSLLQNCLKRLEDEGANPIVLLCTGEFPELRSDPLTEREMEVLKLVARGRSNREIADQLLVAEGTVRTHVSNILSKLHLASRTQATLYALREGLASLDDVEEVF